MAAHNFTRICIVEIVRNDTSNMIMNFIIMQLCLEANYILGLLALVLGIDYERDNSHISLFMPTFGNHSLANINLIQKKFVFASVSTGISTCLVCKCTLLQIQIFDVIWHYPTTIFQYFCNHRIWIRYSFVRIRNTFYDFEA